MAGDTYNWRERNLNPLNDTVDVNKGNGDRSTKVTLAQSERPELRTLPGFPAVRLPPHSIMFTPFRKLTD